MLESALLQHPLYEGLGSVSIRRFYNSKPKPGERKKQQKSLANGHCNIDFDSHEDALRAYHALQTLDLGDQAVLGGLNEGAAKRQIGCSWSTFGSPAVFGEPRIEVVDASVVPDKRRSERWTDIAPPEPTEVSDEATEWTGEDARELDDLLDDIDQMDDYEASPLPAWGAEADDVGDIGEGKGDGNPLWGRDGDAARDTGKGDGWTQFSGGDAEDSDAERTRL
jgi:hypothetical protein